MKRNVNIYIPKGCNVYYASFRFREIDPDTKRVRSRQANRSTRADDKKIAQRIANDMRRKANEGLFADVPKAREDCPTLAKVITIFEKTSKIASKGNVVTKFLTIVAEAEAIRAKKLKDFDVMSRRDLAAARLAARKLPVSVLTADNLRNFRDRETERTSVSINTMIRTARSLFSARAMENYGSLQLPNLEAWLELSLLPEDDDGRFIEIPPPTLAKLDRRGRAALRLAYKYPATSAKRKKWLNAWACYWLIRRCGFRNSEAEKFRGEWLELSAEGDHRSHLIKRPYWKPKGTSGSVPMARDLYEMLAEHLGKPKPGAEGYWLLGTKTDRWDGCNRQLSRIVRKYLPDRTKCAYELRKQWGSEMCKLYGIETAATLLRHADITTAWKHYVTDLKSSKVRAL